MIHSEGTAGDRVDAEEVPSVSLSSGSGEMAGQERAELERQVGAR